MNNDKVKMKKTLNILKDIEIIFFDVGNVIFYDYPSQSLYYYYIYEILKDKIGITIDDFFKQRIEILKKGINDWINYWGNKELQSEWRVLNEKAWGDVLTDWENISIPIHNTFLAIQYIAKYKKLSIIANQPKKTMSLLKRFKISQYFESIFLDQVINISKPNVEMYSYVTEYHQIDPKKCLMIGDRIDNDIYPARQIGMKTLMVALPFCEKSLKCVPKEWGKKYFESINELGNQNKHLFMKDFKDIKADYYTNNLYSFFNLGNS